MNYIRVAILCSVLGLAACGGGAVVGASGPGGTGGAIPVGGATTAPGSTAAPGTTAAPGATATPSANPGATRAPGASPTPASTSSSAPTAACKLPTGVLDNDVPACNATSSEMQFGTGSTCAPAEVVTAGGFSSCNMRWVAHFTIPSTSIGGHYVAANGTYYVSNFANGLYAFDVADPENVKQSGHLSLSLGDPTSLPLVYETENEDLPTNGKIAILSRSETKSAIVVDVHDPANMSVLSTIAGANGHTQNCLDDCLWDYTAFNQSDGQLSSGAHIVNLKDPADPVLLPLNWNSIINNIYVHDITEITPGLIATASDPASIIDTSDPTNPKVVMTLPSTPVEPPPNGAHGPEQAGHIGHSVKWPRGGADKFFMGQSEVNADGKCELWPDDGRTLYSYDTTDWQTTHKFTLVGSYTLVSGTGDTGLTGGKTEVDSHGNPSIPGTTVEACSTHWFDTHPNFDNGGLVALSAFESGVRMLNVAGNGQIQQIGWFVPVGTPSGMADTVGVHWISDRYLATIDFENGGLDIIQYTGPLPASGPIPTTGVMARMPVGRTVR